MLLHGLMGYVRIRFVFWGMMGIVFGNGFHEIIMGIQACMILIYNYIYMYIEIWGYKILCFWWGNVLVFDKRDAKGWTGFIYSGYSQIWSNSGFLEMESISCQRIFLSQFWYTWDLVDMFQLSIKYDWNKSTILESPVDQLKFEIRHESMLHPSNSFRCS